MHIDDIAIIGAGPVGMFGVYHTGLRRMRARLLESLPELGGQLTAMYPEKYIYDVAGYPRILARELIEQLAQQAFRGDLHEICLGEKVEELTPIDEGWRLTTSRGERFARSVLITTGLGAFRPKTLGLPEEETLDGVHYFVKRLADLDGRRIVIVGGGDSAVDWANTFRDRAAVTVVHRLERFQAHDQSVAEMIGAGVPVYKPYEVAKIHGEKRVEGVTIRQVKTGETLDLPCDDLLVCIGFATDLGPVRNWGLALEGGKIKVDTEMRTNLPGVFAAGDCVTYPGRLNLIALGFGEVAIAVASAAAHVRPGERHGLVHSSTRGY